MDGLSRTTDQRWQLFTRTSDSEDWYVFAGLAFNSEQDAIEHALGSDDFLHQFCALPVTDAHTSYANFWHFCTDCAKAWFCGAHACGRPRNVLCWQHKNIRKEAEGLVWNAKAGTWVLSDHAVNAAVEMGRSLRTGEWR